MVQSDLNLDIKIEPIAFLVCISSGTCEKKGYTAIIVDDNGDLKKADFTPTDQEPGFMDMIRKGVSRLAAALNKQ